MALGAAVQGEMSGQMLYAGLAHSRDRERTIVEYRANKHQVRLFNFNGANYRV